ncbi:MAG: sulfotransferase [bacterium]|nr:sulfotransferase [bacterium]
MDTIHLLMLGAPRSGTTLFASMVGRHTEVALLIENEAFAISELVSKGVVGNKLCTPNQIDFGRKATAWVRMLRRLGFPLRKSPSSVYSIEDYLALENSRVMVILRDGNDVLSSIVKRGHQTLELAAYRWAETVRITSRLKDEIGPRRCFVVAYESLVENPEAEMRRAAAFLGLEYEPQMLEGYKFNPIYPGRDEIDKGLAHRAQQQEIDHGLAERFPEEVRLYEELLSSVG